MSMGFPGSGFLDSGFREGAFHAADHAAASKRLKEEPSRLGLGIMTVPTRLELYAQAYAVYSPLSHDHRLKSCSSCTTAGLSPVKTDALLAVPSKCGHLVLEQGFRV